MLTQQLDSFNPATGDRIGSVPVTPVEQVPEIVAQAKRAAPSWVKLSAQQRAQRVVEGLGALVQHEDDLVRLLCREMGKSLRRGRSEVGGVLSSAFYLATEAVAAVEPRQTNGALFEYRPLGVCALISPWNYPLAMVNNLIIPALVAGNTVVFKPSEQTPLIAQAYADALMSALPQHVVQVVHGDGAQGAALVEADVDVIGFTGSLETGKEIMRRAAGGLKRLVMELGGNDPMIVLPDADLRAAARFAVANSFDNSGQSCVATERIYVHESVADQFEALVVSVAESYRMGPWDDPQADIFPLINEAQCQKVISHIDDAVQRGARVLLGGGNHPQRYVRPTVLADVPRDAVMERHETFGPVVSMSRYVDVEEAIARANDSPYGLGAVVYGNKSAEEVASRLEAGMVGINGGVGGGGIWIGAKQSGFGYHGGIDGHRQFAQLRVTV